MSQPSPDSDMFSHDDQAVERLGRPRRWWTRAMILIRRIHLYTGLFLLPWVFLYGVTGAMFNHQGLFPTASIHHVGAEVLAESKMADFPSPEHFAQQVVDALQVSVDNATIKLADDPNPEFTGDVVFELHDSGNRHVIKLDPLLRSSSVMSFPPNDRSLTPMLTDVHTVSLDPDPHESARDAASLVLKKAGVDSTRRPKPLGWTKLNFLADVDGEPARVTYVLKDGHVDVTRYTGDHEMPLRHFLLRLHTAHGQAPHWNGRMLWSFFVDAMAIAMVAWGLSGLLMWWQIKRTRIVGAAVIASSLATAALMYSAMQVFYATTKL